MNERAITALRLLPIPLVWLAFVPYAVAAGHNPGFVSPTYVFHYPTGHVVAACILMAIESAALYGILQPLTFQLRNWRQAVKALGLVFLALMLEPMVTDMPGYVYVNQAFLLVWCIILLGIAILGLLLARLAPASTDAS